MKYLIDTNVLIWWFFDSSRITRAIFNILKNEESTIYYSPLSLWEISIKYGLGKLDLGKKTPEDLALEIGKSFYFRLSVTDVDIASSYRLPRYHNDPFDRMLIWQAIQNDLVFLTADKGARQYIEEGLVLLPEA